MRFVVREMLNGDRQLATLGFMLARCNGGRRYFEVMDRVYAAQDNVSDGAQRAAVAGVARTLGISDADLNACMADVLALQAVLARAQRHKFADGVPFTPTFFVNRQRHDGEIAFDELDRMVRAELP